MQPRAAVVRALLRKRGDPGLGVVDAGFILVRVDLARPVRQAQIQLRIVVKVKCLRQHVHEGGQRSAADRRAAALIVDVQSALGDADDGEFPPGELPQRIVVILLREHDLLPEILFRVQHPVGQTLVRRLRQPSGLQARQVERLGQRQKFARPRRAARRAGQCVGALCALARGDAAVGGDFGRVGLVKANGAHEAEIVHLLCLGVGVQRAHHGRLRQPQAAEKAHAQRHDGRDGRETGPNSCGSPAASAPMPLTTRSARRASDVH